MADIILRGSIIAVPIMMVLYLLSLLRRISRPDHISLWSQVGQFLDDRRQVINEFYAKESEMDKLFKEAGMFFTPGRYRLVRDTLFLILFIALQMKYFAHRGELSYPTSTLFMLVLFYIATLLIPKKPFPIIYLLQNLTKNFNKKKNKEIFLLQQLILNEYSSQQAGGTKQRIYYLFRYLYRYMTHIRPAMVEFIDDYNKYSTEPKRPFEQFGKAVGTEEAISLADILYTIDQTSGDDVQELLKAQYEELKINRQESYKESMQDRGNVGYIIMYMGVLFVIGLGMLMYYLEHQDQMQMLMTNS